MWTDNVKGIDIVIPKYTFKEYSDIYSKTSGSLSQYYEDEPGLTAAGNIDNFPGNSALLKSKQKITGNAENNGTKNADIMVPLKYWSDIWRTLEMSLINCKIKEMITKLVVC